MNRLAFMLLTIAVIVSCSPCNAPSTPDPDAPPNFHVVNATVLRSGQPITPAQWAFVRKRLDQMAPGKMHYVLKLNFDDEGSDDGALAEGLVVIKLPMQPADDRNVFTNIADTFVKPSLQQAQSVDAALRAYAPYGLLVHCWHGEDRTGWTIDHERVCVENWDPLRAYEEAVQYGFHAALLTGLRESLENWNCSTP